VSLESLPLDPSSLPGELASDAGVREDDAYAALLARLSRKSVEKKFEAYVDVPWDDPEYAVDPRDPRFELEPADPLGATAWYRALPQPVRARLGLHLIASFAKIGLQFENVLCRGLLEFALAQPNRSPEFRYCLHEVIEECQHSLMFQEFVNRSGIEIGGLRGPVRFAANQVVHLGRRFPELFFLFVLGGEDPIDHVQRIAMQARPDLHPLVRRISQIHITEEARHLSFARAYLRRHVPRLPAHKRLLLRLRTPLILGNMARLMMQASPELVREYRIPRSVLDEAYRRNPEHLRAAGEALAKLGALCRELEIAVPPFDRLWRRLGIGTAIA
jgi:hypothetical protein